MVREYTRRVANVAPGKTFEPMEEAIGQDHDRMLKSTGPASEALEPQYVQPVDRPLSGLDNEKLANLAFAAEPVTVYIHESSDEKDEQVFVLHNGMRKEIFRRGETKTVPRFFVNTLLAAKKTTYTQKRVRDADGVMHDVQQPRTTLTYPFSIQHDPNPKGRDWYRYMLQQA